MSIAGRRASIRSQDKDTKDINSEFLSLAKYCQISMTVHAQLYINV